jgi:DNA repair protein RecN (Recombination protein N)
MLLELQISDFAIIDHLHLHLEHGFNVLTGETGAGKSIIIDALGMLRGEKTDTTLVRAGKSRARVEGVFSLHGHPDVVAILQEYDLWSEDDEQVILTREISSETGRSTARINRRAVNTSVLREVGSHLIDIHGQHEGLSLFNTRTHLDMLDRYGGLLPLREQVGEQVARLREIREHLADLRRNEARRHERIEELRFLLEDVQAAKLQPNEEQELLQERSMLQNSVRITELVTSSYAMLYQGEESGQYPARPVVEMLGLVVGDLEELARIDPAVQQMAEQATDLHYHLEDLATNLRAYRDALDFDPRRLDEIEDRLTLIRSLQRKYGGDIPELLERAANAEAEIERLTHSAEHMADLEAQEAAQRATLGALAADLSRRRRAIGDELSRLIEGAMADLSMRNVQFAVHFEFRRDTDGVPLPEEAGAAHANGAQQPDLFEQQPAQAPQTVLLACDRTGIDQIEFMISPNPGEPLKPLARIASGGESARLLLALKSILSRVDNVPTLVFDEIDVGVGGRAGQVVGQKLWAITDNHQVICITHLPQVAAFADAHYAISKEVHETEQSGTLATRTAIQALSDEQRIDELAAMLDGTPVSDNSRASAREIIERAALLKHETSEQQRAQMIGDRG